MASTFQRTEEWEAYRMASVMAALKQTKQRRLSQEAINRRKEYYDAYGHHRYGTGHLVGMAHVVRCTAQPRDYFF